jgi:protein ImuA
MDQQLSAGVLNQLRSRIGRLTGSGRVLTGKTFPFHEPHLDAALPWGGLPAGSLHELVGYAPSISGFAAAFLARVRPGRPILWITSEQQPYAPGLAAFGLDHRRLTIAWARRSQDRLWAFEDALRTPGFAAVIAEIDQADLTETRRLQLAAENGNGLGLLVRRDVTPSAALTRWRIETALSDGRNPRWSVALERCRGGQPASWLMEFDHASLHFRLVAALADRSLAAAAE